MKKILLIIASVFICLGFYRIVFASDINGVIDGTYKYVWSENTGWINFGTSEGAVRVTNGGLSGYAWSENIGWISLNCSNDNSCGTVNYGVINDSNGNLSGYAWGENVGWINFAPDNGGVIIGSDGSFSGYAWGENIGWISFSCANDNSCGTANYKVKTDWNPAYSKGDSDGNKKKLSLNSVDKIIDKINYVVEPVKEIVNTGFNNISETLKPFIPSFLVVEKEEKLPEKKPVEEIVPKEAPLALKGKWSLLDNILISKFVLAPLPSKISNLAVKFPEVGKIFKDLGIERAGDITKLYFASLTLPGITRTVSFPKDGEFSLPKGFSVAEIPEVMKEKLPSEIIFARSGNERIDFDMALTLDENGQPQEKIATISGKPLVLVVKIDSPVENVKGYLVFKSSNRESVYKGVPLSQLQASSGMFILPVFAREQEEPVKTEDKLVLLEFEYKDPDNDGIYTAEIDAPVVDGEYEIITVIQYKDQELGTREMRLIAVVDPEGYIYENVSGKEYRIPEANVSLYRKNKTTNNFELWLASDYQQKNPQKTGKDGKYSFLVPEGEYYLSVKAKGYRDYKGDVFSVKAGQGIHTNIELKSKYFWLKKLDWKLGVLFLVVLLLMYNFYKDRKRNLKNN